MNARDLLMHDLRDLYDAEHRLVGALQTMETQVDDRELADAFAQHRRVTQTQIDRLERVFQFLDERPKRVRCAGAEGVVDEYEKLVRKEKLKGDILTFVAAAAALKAEHYEMSAYRAVISAARAGGLMEIAALLEQSYRESEEAAGRLEQMGKPFAMRMWNGGRQSDAGDHDPNVRDSTAVADRMLAATEPFVPVPPVDLAVQRTAARRRPATRKRRATGKRTASTRTTKTRPAARRGSTSTAKRGAGSKARSSAPSGATKRARNTKTGSRTTAGSRKSSARARERS